MTVRTPVWDESADPNIKRGTVTAANGDTFSIPYGKVHTVQLTSTGDNDAIVGATVSGSTVTVSAVDDAGSDIATAFAMEVEVHLDPY